MISLESIILLFILFFSIVLHEFFHGYVAYLNGDDTARILGRLTLNPIPHIDPIGTILLPIILILSSPLTGGVIIGWAKPVPINPFKFKDYDKGMFTVGLAGPLSNIILGTILALISRSFPGGYVKEILFWGAYINFILAFFNLIPIPPLDGSRIIIVFLPRELRIPYERIEKYGIFIVMAFVFLHGLNFIVPVVQKIVSAIAGI